MSDEFPKPSPTPENKIDLNTLRSMPIDNIQLRGIFDATDNFAKSNLEKIGFPLPRHPYDIFKDMALQSAKRKILLLPQITNGDLLAKVKQAYRLDPPDFRQVEQFSRLALGIIEQGKNIGLIEGVEESDDMEIYKKLLHEIESNDPKIYANNSSHHHTNIYNRLMLSILNHLGKQTPDGMYMWGIPFGTRAEIFARMRIAHVGVNKVIYSKKLLWEGPSSYSNINAVNLDSGLRYAANLLTPAKPDMPNLLKEQIQDEARKYKLGSDELPGWSGTESPPGTKMEGKYTPLKGAMHSGPTKFIPPDPEEIK